MNEATLAEKPASSARPRTTAMQLTADDPPVRGGALRSAEPPEPGAEGVATARRREGPAKEGTKTSLAKEERSEQRRFVFRKQFGEREEGA